MTDVYVGNFNSTYTEEDLRDVFKKYGVQQIRIHKKDDSKVFAFIKLSSLQAANNAVRELHHAERGGRKLIVRPTREKPKGEGGGGSTSSGSGRSSSSGDTGYPSSAATGKGVRRSNRSAAPKVDYSIMPGLEPIGNNPGGGHQTQVAHAEEGPCVPTDSPLGKVAVSCFPYGSSEAEVMSIFADFEPVMCRIMINAPTGRVSTPTYAFVYLPDTTTALAAEKALNHFCYKGSVLGVKKLSL